LHGKEPIYNLIIELLSINGYYAILRWIDLEANDSMDKYTLVNTNSCIESIAENSMIDLMNVREQYCFGDNSFHKKAPNLLESDLSCLFGLPKGWTGFDRLLTIKLRLVLILPQFIPARSFTVPRCSQRSASNLPSSLRVLVYLLQNGLRQ
jgi:hypothetical protein